MCQNIHILIFKRGSYFYENKCDTIKNENKTIRINFIQFFFSKKLNF